MAHTRNAETDEQKNGILQRLGAVWKANPELRLMQLLGNVYDRRDAYYRPDCDMVADVEEFYTKDPGG